jgi:ethanolamine utilization microcompartment shell protein EutS
MLKCIVLTISVTNKSGTVRVQIVDEFSGKYVLFQTFGSCSSDSAQIKPLISKGKRIIANHGCQSILAFDKGNFDVL